MLVRKSLHVDELILWDLEFRGWRAFRDINRLTSFVELWDPRWLVGIQRHVYQSESILDGPFHWWLSKEKHWHWLFGLKKCVHWSELSLISWMGLEWILIVACFPDCRLHHLFLSLWGLPYSQLVWQSRPHKTFISMKIGTWSQLLF